jgi:hypothetical protein
MDHPSGVLLATRRRRSPEDPQVWASHVAAVEGESLGVLQHETDRARFQRAPKAAQHGSPFAGILLEANDFNAVFRGVKRRDRCALRLHVSVVDDDDAFAVSAQVFNQRGKRLSMPIARNDRAKPHAAPNLL